MNDTTDDTPEHLRPVCVPSKSSTTFDFIGNTLRVEEIVPDKFLVTGRGARKRSQRTFTPAEFTHTFGREIVRQ